VLAATVLLKPLSRGKAAGMGRERADGLRLCFVLRAVRIFCESVNHHGEARRGKGVSMEATIEELTPHMRGWRSGFGFCETPEVRIGLTRGIRLRLRASMWRQWSEVACYSEQLVDRFEGAAPEHGSCFGTRNWGGPGRIARSARI
jgi:group II intron maturase